MTARAIAPRRWALTKLDAGRYYLHGNDVEASATGYGRGGTLFRMERWVDGPHLGVERVAVRWTLSEARWDDVRRSMESAVGDPFGDVAWEHVAELDTRRDCISEAVAISEARRQEVAR